MKCFFLINIINGKEQNQESAYGFFQIMKKIFFFQYLQKLKIH